MRKLALLDLEGTLTDFEFWEELAKIHNKNKELEELLEAGLSGHNWYESFVKRVEIILGTPKEQIETVAKKILDRIKPEAVSLVSELKKRGFVTIIVSGGFEDFVEPVARTLGVDDYVAQKFIYHEGRVAGVLPIFKEKEEIVEKLEPWFDFIFAVGDGFNDFNMLKRAHVAAVVGKRAKTLGNKLGVRYYEDLSSLVRDLVSGELGKSLN